MSRYLHRYPLDPSGKSPGNLVQREARTLESRARRAIVPTYGAFFSASLKIRDSASNTVLERGVHYIISRIIAEPTARFSQEVSAVIVITDPHVSNTVELQYQVVGGEYEDLLLPILDMIEIAKLDSRSVEYMAIENRPTEFNPVRHLHDLGDIYGFEPVVHAVERARMAMEVSSVIDYDNYYRYVDTMKQSLAAVASALASKLLAKHAVDPMAHSQYILRTKVDSVVFTVRTPAGITPSQGAAGVQRNLAFKLSPYYSMYRNPQKAIQVQIARDNSFGTLEKDVVLEGVTDTYQIDSLLTANTMFFWRARYQSDDLSWSDWSAVTYFSTRAV